MYAKVESGSVTNYPYTFLDLRSDNRNVSFPAFALQDADIRAAYNVVEVQATAHANLKGYNYVEGTPVKDGDVWKQVWAETAKNAADLDASEITATALPETEGKEYDEGTPELGGDKIWRQTWVARDRDYRENRLAEYGDINEQLEYIVENGIAAFITKQEAVKAKWPKS